MKKLLFALLAGSFVFASCERDPIEEPAIEFSLASTAVSNSARAISAEIDAKVKFKNLESTPITVKWQRYDVNIPTDWQVAVCDNEQCRVPAVTEYTMTIPANDSFELKLVAYPNGVIGTGTARIRLYDPADSARTVRSVLFEIEGT